MTIKAKTIDAIMTKTLVIFKPDTIMSEVVDVIEKSDFHHFPVIDIDGVCIGVLSKSDYFQIQDAFTKSGHRTAATNNQMMMRSLLVSEVMTSPAVTRDINDSIEDIINLFIENKYGSVVITKDEKCAGIITPIDILKNL